MTIERRVTRAEDLIKRKEQRLVRAIVEWVGRQTESERHAYWRVWARALHKESDKEIIDLLMGGREDVTLEDEQTVRAMCERAPTVLLKRFENLSGMSLLTVLELKEEKPNDN